MENYPPATLFGTHTRKLTSSIVGQDYELQVSLPLGYDDAPDKTYPVVYILDGNLEFGMAHQMAFWLMWSKEIPPVILVGIGVPITSYDDCGQQRNRDFTPTPHDQVAGSGGAANFLAFFETELIPFVNANYRSAPANQNIWGYSLGGLFVLYALLRRPGLFQRIIAGSPSVEWDQQVLFGVERELAEQTSLLPAVVHITVGSEEGEYVQLSQQFADALASRKYQGLSLKYAILAKLTCPGWRVVS